MLKNETAIYRPPDNRHPFGDCCLANRPGSNKRDFATCPNRDNLESLEKFSGINANNRHARKVGKNMKGQDFIYFVFLLILGYLLLSNWKGANALLTSGVGGSVAFVKTLQGR